MRPLTLKDIEAELIELADAYDSDELPEKLRALARRIGVQLALEVEA